MPRLRRLRDDQWDWINDILPGRVGSVGATAADNRLFVDAVLYRYRTGIPWRDLPDGRWYGDNYPHCGTCVPCIIRRAAILEAWKRGNDPTDYRCNDISARPLDAATAEGQQIRGYQYALERLNDNPRLARALIHKPGPLLENLQQLESLVGVYERGMAEVGRLLDGVRTFSSAMPDQP
jgi:Putative transposase of IS4/5 family (DUF4096)